MENVKKRKLEETENKSESSSNIEIRSLVECIPKPQLVDLLSKLGCQNPSIAEQIKTIAAPYVAAFDRKIFVSSLNYVTETSTLRQKFQEYGEIENAIVIRDRVTGKSKGYGFVTYKDIQSVNNALSKPKIVIDGASVACRLADDGQRVSHRKLFIGNLPPIFTNENLCDKFKMHGEIEEAIVCKNPIGEWKNRYGFVTYKTVEAAKKAIDYNDLHEGSMTVKYADSQSRPPLPGGVASRAVLPMTSGPGYVRPQNVDVNYGARNGYTYPQSAAVLPYAAPPYPQSAAVPPSDAPPYPQSAAVPTYAAPPYPQSAEVPPSAAPPYPQSAAVPTYAAPPYQTNGQGPYPHVSAVTGQFGHQYYYNNPYPNQ
ncbi:UBP1-associated protein 2C-like [Vicia villosa]|uniref:UBP1-associated protein 2C-like n=1 Tax=Vicia villosa TaxID=3911 RepID=UPI00273C0C24|nr:UBP1-associated protein 2C-like [Vicia villosa]